MDNVIDFDRRSPETAVERLNRHTGLDFREWPESLLREPEPRQEPAAEVHSFQRAVEENPRL